MTAVEYLPGDRWLVAGASTVVQLVGEPSQALRWWSAVRSGAGAAELIGQLHRDGVLGSGTGLAIVCVELPAGDRASGNPVGGGRTAADRADGDPAGGTDQAGEEAAGKDRTHPPSGSSPRARRW